MTAKSIIGFLRVARLALAAWVALGGTALVVRADEGNPFVPPSQREADREAQIQQRVEKAVSDLEGRIVQSLVNSLEGKGGAGGREAPLAEALKKLTAANSPPPPQPSPQQSSPFASGGGGGVVHVASDRGGGFPALPPLPGATAARESPVPPGSTFIGCLDRKAFFQDQVGSPFLVDPAAFPSSGAGPGACGR